MISDEGAVVGTTVGALIEGESEGNGEGTLVRKVLALIALAQISAWISGLTSISSSLSCRTFWNDLRAERASQ